MDQTLILFFSDNGATGNVGSNNPFRGTKGQVYEGGHRVPAALYWKEVIESGESDDLVLTMDILPTFAQILDIDTTEKTNVSGISFASLIDERYNKGFENQLNGRTVFWRFREQKAAKKDEWKLVINGENEELYDLSQDISETTDVKREYPEIFRELKQALDQWELSLNEEQIVAF